MKRSFITIMFSIFMSGVLLFVKRVSAAEEIFKITSIDVGKGDCILVQTGAADDPVNVMIDTGYKETAGDVLAYLETHNVQKLDALVISHYHKDHVGGAAAILKGIPVSMVYMPDYEGTRKVYEEMMAVLKDSGGAIPYKRLSESMRFSLGNAVYDLYPSQIPFDGDNDNDVSMSACLEYDGYTALFAGDLEDAGIDQFLKNNNIPEKHYDILKLPHHGAEGKNTGDLVSRSKPEGIVLVTDGQDRRAHGSLIDTLEKDGFRTYCSAEDGTVVITANEAGFDIQKSKNPEYRTFGDWKYFLSDDGSAVLAGYIGNASAITIPSSFDGYPVKSIFDSAFYNHKNLTSVTIPEGVESIGDSAFSWCTGLTDVMIPGSVTSIGKAVFSWCTKLEEITLPDNVKSIGESGFESCTTLKSVKLSNGLTAIAPSLFERCGSLESIQIPAGVASIGEDAFKFCMKLSDVTIPSSVTLIDEGAFKGCHNLKKIDIPEGVKSIEESAFEWCIALRSIKIPDSVTSLGKAAFMDCENLESAEIGTGVKTIKKSTFSGCTALKRVTIPVSVGSIKGDAFKDCGSLKDIYYAGTTEQWDAVSKDKNWDQSLPADLKIHCSDSEPEPDDPEPPAGIRFFDMRELPATGFSAKQPGTLSIQPKDLRYDPTGLTLQIPSLDVSEEIVTVPFRNGEYPVEWLKNAVGLPEEFPLPGSGPSILAAHNHLNASEAGPFALIGTLSENDMIFISGRNGELLTFSVFANEKVSADDFSFVRNLSAAYGDSLILITCEDERPEGGYASRRVVGAKTVF